MAAARHIAIGPAMRASGPAAGSPVLLLHSTASTGGQWAGLAARLAQRYRVFTPDIAGWGKAVGTHHATLEDEAAELARNLATVDRPIHLVGHSMGGAVAVRLALMIPDRIKSIALIEPVLFHLLRDGDHADRALHLEISALARRMNAAGVAAPDMPFAGRHENAAARSAAAMKTFIDFWSGPGAWDALNPACRDALAPMAATVAANFAQLDRACFALSAVAEITAPALLLVGGASRPETQRITVKLFDTLPLARLGLIAGAGHMLPITHAAAVNERVESQIDALEGYSQAILAMRPHAA